MRSLLSIGFFMFYGALAVAAPAKNSESYKSKIWASFLILNTQMERNNEQEVRWVQGPTFAASYSRNQLEFLLEYSQNRNSSGNETSQIEKERAVWNLWVRLFNLKKSEREPWSLYLGLAAGIYEDTVITTFMGDARKDTSGKKPQLGGKLGVEYRASIEKQWELQLRFEGRGFYGQNLEPNPTAGFQGSLGLAYSF